MDDISAVNSVMELPSVFPVAGVMMRHWDDWHHL
jgi:hypothetical protein